MSVPGYDPIDVDHMLESRLSEDEIADHLTESELASYRNGGEALVDLLDPEEIEAVLEL